MLSIYAPPVIERSREIPTPPPEGSTYSVYSWWGEWQDDLPGEWRPKRVHGGWLLRDNRATKWRLRKWLRKLYGESFDCNTISINRNESSG